MDEKSYVSYDGVINCPCIKWLENEQFFNNWTKRLLESQVKVPKIHDFFYVLSHRQWWKDVDHLEVVSAILKAELEEKAHGTLLFS